MDEQQQREEAISRIKERREFGTHLVAYVVVNGFLVVVWAFTSGGYFWPIWPMAGWGIGLLIHAWETFRRPISEADIRKEMDKGR
jgi:vacuolar-type H+-ATPase subunit I/STV1